MRRAFASFPGVLRPGEIDQDLPHQAGSNGKEVISALPIRGRAADEPHKGFIHQRRGLQQVPVTLSDHVAPGQPVQFLVNDRRQAFESRRIPAAPGF